MSLILNPLIILSHLWLFIEQNGTEEHPKIKFKSNVSIYLISLQEAKMGSSSTAVNMRSVTAPEQTSAETNTMFSKKDVAHVSVKPGSETGATNRKSSTPEEVN